MFSAGPSKSNNAVTLNTHSVPVQSDPPSTITNYAIPTANSTPNAIIPGSDNHTFWFTEFGAGKIGEFSTLTKNVTKEYSINETGAMPATLALDNRGLIWFTDENSATPSIWSLNTTNGIFHRILTGSPSDPIFVIVDPSTNFVWFTDYSGNYLGEITGRTDTIVKHSFPEPKSYPVEIAKQNGTSYLWITEAGGRISRFDTSTNATQEYTPTVPLIYPVGVAIDKSGNVWVGEHGGSSITEFLPTNSTWRKYPTSQSTASPGTGVATMSIDSLGRLWFAEHYANRIGRFDPASGQMVEFSLPIIGAYSLLDTIDSHGNFWFTEATANEIGTILGNATTTVSIRPVTTVDNTVTAGSSAKVVFQISNINQTNSISLDLNVTSSFTTNYFTTQSEVSLSSYQLTIGPGQSRNVTATVSPDFALGSGFYSAGIVANSGNTSTIRVTFLQVSENPLHQIETLTPEILIAAAGVLLAVFLYTRVRRKWSVSRTPGPKSDPKTPLAACLLVLSVLAVQAINPVWGKCPGLPPPPNSSGPDLYGIAIDVGAVTFFAVVAYLLIRSRLHDKG